ncbi:hypothetical protein QAD02_010200, partial [Eretmocerus hayati]
TFSYCKVQEDPVRLIRIMLLCIARCTHGLVIHQSIQMKMSFQTTSTISSSSQLPIGLRNRNQNYSTNFAEEYSQRRIELSVFQRALLAAGSAGISLTNPYRGDMIACLGETTGESALKYCRAKMLETEEGKRIIDQMPRINSRDVDLQKLAELPEGSVGRTYADFLSNNKVSPDDRPPVQFVEDIDLAYVMQRYREVHDIFHAMLLMPTTMLGEVAVKWVEALQLRLPMCIGGAIFGAARLKPKQRQLYLKYHLPWALQTGRNAKFLLGVYFEERWEQSLDEFHKEMNIKRLI